MDIRQRQLATLASVESEVRVLIDEHLMSRGMPGALWMPSDFAGTFDRATAISDEALVALVYNTLTEEGLPSFHRLIASHLGERSVWGVWNGIWTAEESRHGRALSMFLGGIPQLKMRAYDEMLFTYHVEGFHPEWEQNPYRLLAYTVMQERATQISHANVAHMVKDTQPSLARMLAGGIAPEESRHCRFYSEVFRLVLKRDTTEALKALRDEIRSFAMPGAMIPYFDDYQYLAERAEVFTTGHFKGIVEGVIKLFKLKELRAEEPEGEHARKVILKMPGLLMRRIGQNIVADLRDLEFPFLRDTMITL